MYIERKIIFVVNIIRYAMKLDEENKRTQEITKKRYTPPYIGTHFTLPTSDRAYIHIQSNDNTNTTNNKLRTNTTLLPNDVLPSHARFYPTQGNQGYSNKLYSKGDIFTNTTTVSVSNDEEEEGEKKDNSSGEGKVLPHIDGLTSSSSREETKVPPVFKFLSDAVALGQGVGASLTQRRKQAMYDIHVTVPSTHATIDSRPVLEAGWQERVQRDITYLRAGGNLQGLSNPLPPPVPIPSYAVPTTNPLPVSSLNPSLIPSKLPIHKRYTQSHLQHEGVGYRAPLAHIPASVKLTPSPQRVRATAEAAAIANVPLSSTTTGILNGWPVNALPVPIPMLNTSNYHPSGSIGNSNKSTPTRNTVKNIHGSEETDGVETQKTNNPRSNTHLLYRPSYTTATTIVNNHQQQLQQSQQQPTDTTNDDDYNTYTPSEPNGTKEYIVGNGIATKNQDEYSNENPNVTSEPSLPFLSSSSSSTTTSVNTTMNNNTTTNTQGSMMMNPSLLSSVALLAADISNRFEKTNSTLMTNLNSLQNRMNQIEEGTKKLMKDKNNLGTTTATIESATATNVSALTPSMVPSTGTNIYNYVDTNKLFPSNNNYTTHPPTKDIDIMNASYSSSQVSEEIMHKNKVSDRTLARIAELTGGTVGNSVPLPVVGTNGGFNRTIQNNNNNNNTFDDNDNPDNNNPRYRAALERMSKRRSNNNNNNSDTTTYMDNFVPVTNTKNTSVPLPPSYVPTDTETRTNNYFNNDNNNLTSVDEFLQGIATRFAAMDAQVARTKPLLQATDNLLYNY